MSEKNLPFWGFVKAVIQTAAGYLWIAVQPHEELFWLWAITFPLTLVWMFEVRTKSGKVFSAIGSRVISGSLALSLALILGSWLLEGVLWIWNQPWYFMIPIVVIAFFAIRVILKIPGVNPVARKVFGFCKKLVLGVWRLHGFLEKNLNFPCAVFGALFIAGLLNGQLATGLTDTKGLLPGIIPGISAAVGLFILLRLLVKTIRQRKTVEKTEQTEAQADSDSTASEETKETADTEPTASVAAPAATASEASAASEAPAEAGHWMQCVCGELNFLYKTPQYCEVCGAKLRDFAPAGKSESSDELPSCSAPSFREVWWDIP